MDKGKNMAAVIINNAYAIGLVLQIPNAIKLPGSF